MQDTDNIYGWGRAQTFERFEERLEGNRSGLVAVISCDPLNERARDALQKSFAALGYGVEACTFALIDGLDAKELFGLVEGIDPLCLVATDADAATLYAQAVRAAFPPMQKTRLFGREARAFPRLNDQLEEERDRQIVWHLLKSLPAAG